MARKNKKNANSYKLKKYNNTTLYFNCGIFFFIEKNLYVYIPI